MAAPRSSWLWALAAMAAGCVSEPIATGPDAGSPPPDAGAVSMAQLATPPAPAGLPVLTPCASGWREVTEDRLTVCEPWPATGWTACGPGEAHFPGNPGCTSVGPPCGAGDWTDDLPATGVVFVRPGGSAAADGSRAAPFGSIAAALANIGAARLITLARGRYPEHAEIPAGITVRGACAAETIVGPDSPTIVGQVTASGTGASVERVTIVGGVAGIYLTSGDLQVHDVVIEGSGLVALFAEAATITGDHVVVRNTRGNQTGARGEGIVAQRGARIELANVLVTNAGSTGVLAGDAVVRLRDVAVLDTRGTGMRSAGVGVSGFDGAQVELVRAVIERSIGEGLGLNRGSTGLLEDVIIRGTAALPDGQDGRGIFALAASRITARRLRVDDNRDLGVGLQERSEGAFEDLVIRRTASQTYDLDNGYGLWLQAGSVVTATRAAVVASRKAAVIAVSSTLDVTDLLVRDTLPREFDEVMGVGLLSVGSNTRVVRAEILRSVAVGVWLDGGGPATVEDLTVDQVDPAPGDGTAGIGLTLENTRLSLVRARISRVGSAGIYADGSDVATHLAATDVRVEQAEGEPASGLFGLGMVIQGQATADLSGIEVDGNRDVGIVVIGSTVTASRVRIARTRRRLCGSTHCPNEAMGVGLSVGFGSVMRLEDFTIVDNNLAGIQLLEHAELDLARGTVSGHPIGVALQVEGFDITRLTGDVAFIDNDLNLDSRMLPVPPAFSPPLIAQ